MKTKIIELTEENKDNYIDQVAELEKRVLKQMEENGKIGQLFITGKEDILEYIKSKKDMVICSLNGEDRINSAAYITQGQIPFTYNDITKYFKCSDGYKEYVKKLFGDKYKQKMLQMYKVKVKAFADAKKEILKKYPQYENIIECITNELNSENGFDEKNEIREELNKYMFKNISKLDMQEQYEYFYWVTAKDIFKEFEKDGNLNKQEIQEYEFFMEHQNFEIHSSNLEEESVYYSSNTTNSIELDTYITDPQSRDAGLARILVFEGIKRKIEEYFKNEENKGSKELFLCSTLHKENLSSKYVSEFFGLIDNLYVKRRKDRDREVHICRIEREKYKDYLNDIEDRLIALYGYNPTNKDISIERKIDVLQEQLNYEEEQYRNLNINRNNKHDYKGMNSLINIIPKLNKIGQIKQKIKQLQNMQKGDER